MGVTTAKDVAKRMQQHFSLRAGAAFTKAHRPLGIELLQPVLTSAAEAFVYYAMVQHLGLKCVLNRHLGGWTQTGVSLDGSAKAVAKRDFFMLAGKCLVCGKDNCLAETHGAEQKRGRSDNDDAVRVEAKRPRPRVENLLAKLKEAADKVSKTLGRTYPRVRVLQ